MFTSLLPTQTRHAARWQHVAHSFLPGPHATQTMYPSDVTDAQWEQIVPYVHAVARKGGRPLKNQRDVLNGVLYVLTNACAWRQMPSSYGNYVTCWRRLLRWQSTGIWRRIEHVLGTTQHPLMRQKAESAPISA